MSLQSHSHGKDRVRVLKVRRSPDGHSISEYTCKVVVESHAKQAFTSTNNYNVVATDSIKNTVYLVAKDNKALSPEEFGVQLVDFFLKKYAGIVRIRIRDNSKWLLDL